MRPGIMPRIVYSDCPVCEVVWCGDWEDVRHPAVEHAEATGHPVTPVRVPKHARDN